MMTMIMKLKLQYIGQAFLCKLNNNTVSVGAEQ